MISPMRFLGDMGISVAVIRRLRKNGHDAIHLSEQNLQKLPDKDVFLKALDEKRIVLTFDLDFGEIAALFKRNPSSVIVFRTRNARAEYIAGKLDAALEVAAEDLEKGCILTIEDSRIRVRRLPIGG